MNNRILSRTRATLSVAGLAAISVLLGGADTAAAMATCSHSWQLMRAPGTVPLHDVSATGPNHVWVVGEDGYAAHMHEGKWQEDRLPNGVQMERIAGVAGFTWGVGMTATGRWVALHWVKDRWRIAHIFATNLEEPSIAVNRDHEVWLTGRFVNSSGFYSWTLISLRDGRWSRPRLPDGGVAFSVATVSRTSTMAVGSAGSLNYTWRWNGKTWTSGKRIFTDVEDLDEWTTPWRVALADNGHAFVTSMFDEGDCCHISFYPSQLFGGSWHTAPYRFGTPFDIVTTATADSATVVGDDFYGDSGGGSYYGVIYQWDGNAWVTQTLQGLQGPSNYYAIDADSNGRLWMVGADQNRGPVLARQCSPL